MNQLKEEIINEIDVRINELSKIIRKTSQIDDNYVNKFFLIAIYANWKTFIKNSLRFYVNYLHNHDLLKNSNYISLIIKYEKLFERNLTDQNQIKIILDKIDKININPKFDTNKIKFKIMNFDNTNKLFKEFNLPEFNRDNRIKLNTLVKQRNWIAHGVQEVCLNDISVIDIREYVNLIEELMDEFLLNILNYYDNNILGHV